MYLPAHFEQTDPQAMRRLVAAEPLATWIVPGADGPLVNHVPFMLDAGRGPHGTLIGHVARQNPVWQALADTRPVIAVFQGPQAYVSPGWYPGKAVHGKVVPTWNYAIVHAHGTARAVLDRTRLLEIVATLTDLHERPRARPWAVSDAPADYIDTMLGAIVGIEITVERWVGKWKTSQNRSAADRAGVAAGLRAEGEARHDVMARWVDGDAR